MNCGCASTHGFTSRPSSSVVPPMYSAWPVNTNDWLPALMAEPQFTSNIQLLPVFGAPPPFSRPVLASMKAVTSVFRK